MVHRWVRARFAAGCVVLSFTSLQGAAIAAPAEEVSLEESVLAHEPITEHAAGHPIPLVVASEDIRIAYVLLHYKTRGRWHQSKMKHRRGEYRTTIRCDVVSGADRVLYYIEAQDDFKKTLDTLGTEDEPMQIELDRRSDHVAHFPGEKAPAACEKLKAVAAAPCDGEGCAEAEGHEEPPGDPWVWASVSVMQDAQLGGGTDVCTPESQQSNGFACIRRSGSAYLGTPLPGSGGTSGAFQLATTRALLGLDFAVLDTFTLGMRGGYAFGGGPAPAGGSAFLPLHAEGRAALWFAERAYADSGFAPYAVLAAGVGQVDSSGTTPVAEDRTVPPPPSQLDNPDNQQLEVWKKSGVGFASVGVGGFVATGQRHGFILEARAAFLFPSPGVALSLAAGFALSP